MPCFVVKEIFFLGFDFYFFKVTHDEIAPQSLWWGYKLSFTL